MPDQDRDYLQRRVREECERVELATDPTAYRTHLALAQEYESRLLALARESGHPTPSEERTRFVLG